MDWDWVSFGVGFAVGIMAMWLWACMAVSGMADDEAERRRGK